MLVVAPKPPKPVEEPAVAVLPPNTPPLLVVLVPKAGRVPPKAFVEVLLEPNPVPIEDFVVSDDQTEGIWLPGRFFCV